MSYPAKKTAVFSALVLSLTLVACGGDKKAEQSAPAATTDKAPAQAAAQPEAAKPEETKEAAQADASVAEPTKEAVTPSVEKAAEVTTDQAPIKALSIEEGKKRYEQTCKVCHDQGLLDAPKLSDKAEWAKRLEKGVDTLHKHSAKGFNKMPAQAMGNVSEAEVYAAVDYMLEQAK